MAFGLAHLVAVEIGVAGVQQPAPVVLDGDAGMARGVAGQGDHQNFRRQAGQVAHAGEAVPSLAPGLVEMPIADALPLRRTVAAPTDEAVALALRIPLPLQHMDLGLGKVVQAAGVVEIQMGQHDMADIARTKTQAAELRQGAEFGIVLDAIHQPEEGTQAPAALPQIGFAKAGIHQHQAVPVGFHQQAVTGEVGGESAAEAVVQRPAQGAHAAAV